MSSSPTRAGPDVVGAVRASNPGRHAPSWGGLLLGRKTPARCCKTPAATPSNAGRVVQEQRLSPRADTQSADVPLLGRVRGNPALSK